MDQPTFLCNREKRKMSSTCNYNIGIGMQLFHKDPSEAVLKFHQKITCEEIRLWSTKQGSFVDDASSSESQISPSYKLWTARRHYSLRHK